MQWKWNIYFVLHAVLYTYVLLMHICYQEIIAQDRFVKIILLKVIIMLYYYNSYKIHQFL